MAVILTALVVAQAALAADPSLEGYGSSGSSVQGEVQQGAPPPAPPSEPPPAPPAEEPVEPAVEPAQPAVEEPVEGVLSQVGGTVEVDSGTLPFTGLDLALIVGAGVALLAIGVLLRRLGRARADAA